MGGTPLDPAQVKRDFLAFADPATAISVDAKEVRWTQNREQRVAYLGHSPAGTTLRFREQMYAYGQFFASETMADLRGLAESLVPYLRTLPSYVPDTGYVPGRASSEALDTVSQSAESLLNEACGITQSRGPDGTTRVVFLKGRAGDGKSSLLVATTMHAATGYLSGSNEQLFFYIDAQGRALARVDEAIALILQDIRARFTYHAVSVLTRLGLIVPIIDGFDELLGPGGYQDAFSSLGRFLERLEGKGCVVASARSTFYQYTTFGQHAGRLVADGGVMAYRILPVDLEPWSDEELSVLLEKRGSMTALGVPDVATAIARLRVIAGNKHEEIFSSPFLATRLLDLVAHGASTLESGSVVGSIIRDLVEREAVEKLRSSTGVPLLSVDDHLSLLGEIAEEMWIQQSRELDETTFMTIVDIQCEEVFSLTPVDAEKVVKRMPAHALLARTDRPARIGFRHEFYFAYFLGERLAQASATPSAVQTYLHRSPLSNLVAEEFADAVLRRGSAEHMRGAVTALASHAGFNIPRAMELVAHQNAGTLLASLLQRAPTNVEGADITLATFVASALVDLSISNCKFKRCEFERVDLRGTQMSNVEFDECSFRLVVMDERTKFVGCTGISASSFVGLVYYVAGSRREEYDPRSIADWLLRAGAIQDGPVRTFPTPAASALLDSTLGFLRVIRTSPYFSGNDFENRGLNMDRDFRDVMLMLKRHHLLADAEGKSRQGTRKMYRITVPAEQIALGASSHSISSDIEDFWDDVAATVGTVRR